MDLSDANHQKQVTRQALEEYAEEVFDVHVVATRIRRAAKLGRTSVHIPQDRPLDLSGTTAATLLILHLESLGYATSWDEARRIESGSKHETGHEFIYCELLVEWRTRSFA